MAAFRKLLVMVRLWVNLTGKRDALIAGKTLLFLGVFLGVSVFLKQISI